MAAHLTGIHSAIKMLNSRIRVLHQYLGAMQKGILYSFLKSPPPALPLFTFVSTDRSWKKIVFVFTMLETELTKWFRRHCWMKDSRGPCGFLMACVILYLGDIPCDNSLLRQVASLLRSLPAAQSEKFKEDFLMVSSALLCSLAILVKKWHLTVLNS